MRWQNSNSGICRACGQHHEYLRRDGLCSPCAKRLGVRGRFRGNAPANALATAEHMAELQRRVQAKLPLDSETVPGRFGEVEA